ncbi:MAG: ferredoxin, partial [Chloroflexota bacterium]|nr:ferredoxin [Chloroflexota bacterium]
MKVSIDKDLCIDCGVCEALVPEVFRISDEGVTEVILNPVPEELQDAVREAAEECSTKEGKLK